MYLAHHERAVSTGARLVHACGFDSVPHDLGALFTVQQLPAGQPTTVRGVVRSNAMFSGGTFHSALGQMARAREMRQAARERKALEPQSEDRRARAKAGSIHRDPELGLWLVPLPTCDPMIVKRSAAARGDYSPDFTYSHYAGLKRLATVAAAAVGVGALAAAAQVPALRRALGNRVPQGQGPDEARRARSWFTVNFMGEAAGRKVHTQVRGGDPGYCETAKMLAESAMCLAFEDNPPTSGQVTTATAMGESLSARLTAAGISFTVVAPASASPSPATDAAEKAGEDADA